MIRATKRQIARRARPVFVGYATTYQEKLGRYVVDHTRPQYRPAELPPLWKPHDLKRWEGRILRKARLRQEAAAKRTKRCHGGEVETFTIDGKTYPVGSVGVMDIETGRIVIVGQVGEMVDMPAELSRAIEEGGEVTFKAEPMSTEVASHVDENGRLLSYEAGPVEVTPADQAQVDAELDALAEKLGI